MNSTFAKLAVILPCSTAGEKTYEDSRIHEDIGWIADFHRCVIKPLSYYFSSRVLRKKIMQSIGKTDGKTFIDVSAGDDTLALELAKGARWVLLNDISRYALQPLKDKRTPNMKFRVGNLMTIRGPRADWVICKNTLHHLKTVKQLEKAMRKLRELGRNVVIMDVENPMLTPRARAWNSYYRFILKDQGGFFIDFCQFIRTVQVCFPAKYIEFNRIKTIKGNYMLAVVKEEK